MLVGRATKNAAWAQDGAQWIRFRYQVVEGDLDADGISIDAGTADGSGGGISGGNIYDMGTTTPVDRSFPAVAREENHKVDGVRPTVSSVALTSNAGGDNTYRATDHVQITVQFSELVTVTGNPELTLEVGSSTRTANLVRPSTARQELVFQYLVQPGDVDTDGVSIAAGSTSFTGGTISDVPGNAANDRDFDAVADQRNHRVDGVAPTAQTTRIVSDAGADGVYSQGDRIEVAAQFSEAVRTGADTTLAIRMGDAATPRVRRAAYNRGNTTNTLVFRYTVAAGDMDADGISVSADAVMGEIIDLPGNALSGGIRSLAEDSAHRVDGGADTRPPRATRVAITSSGTNGWYGIGRTIAATVYFDEVVDVITAVRNPPTLDISVGENTRQATWDNSTNNTSALRFEYDVQAGEMDADGISIAAGAQSLRGADIEDAAGNEANRSFPATGNQAAHKVDGVRPEVSDVEVVSNAGSDDTYAKGDNIDIRVTFSERVYVTHALALEMDIMVGGEGRDAYLLSGSGSNALTFRYRVQDDSDNNGISIAAGALGGGDIEDHAGNDWVETTWETLPDQARHRVDGIAATATAIEFASDAGTDNTYVAGDRIELEVTFDKNVTVGGNPVLLLAFDDPSVEATSRRAALVRTRPRILTFRYTVVTGDEDNNGLSVDEGALVGGTIRDTVGNFVDRTLNEIVDHSDHAVDAVAPTPSNVAVTSSPLNGGTYRFDETIEVSVTFDENAYVTDAVTLGLSIGAYTRRARYATGSGTPTLVFRYQVQADDLDEDGISVGPDALQGGRIEDGAGNDWAVATADRRIQPLTQQPGHKVDGSVQGTTSSGRRPVHLQSGRLRERPLHRGRRGRSGRVLRQGGVRHRIGRGRRGAAAADPLRWRTLARRPLRRRQRHESVDLPLHRAGGRLGRRRHRHRAGQLVPGGRPHRKCRRRPGVQKLPGHRGESQPQG